MLPGVVRTSPWARPWPAFAFAWEASSPRGDGIPSCEGPQMLVVEKGGILW